MTTARYAIYFAPEEGSDLADFGRLWLDQDAADRSKWVIAPCRYGFHATLKAPMRLAEGRTLGELEAAFDDFAAGLEGFVEAPLRLSRLGNFLALRPSGPTTRLDRLAEACLGYFEPFRAPPSPAELLKRMAPGLTERQRQLIEQWGYPFVLDQYRFHMSVTGAIDSDAERRTVQKRLKSLVSAVEREALAVLSLCLFEQTSEDVPFTLHRRRRFAR